MTRLVQSADIVVVGGGISGVSLAARLAPHARVIVLEAAEQLGTQATGRSAALLVQAYGPAEIRQLTSASRAFFEAPPAGFADAPLARRRGGLVFGRADEEGRLQHEFALALQSTGVVWLGTREIALLCPILRPDHAALGFLEPNALDLDTHALLHGFARIVRNAGSAIVAGSPVRTIEPGGMGYRVETNSGTFECTTLVNAAGAWADEVASLAGIDGCGLSPKRRTAATVTVPSDIAALLPRLPFASPVDESFYFKPEVGAIMVSLAEESPSPPCDAWPDDFDVATALERFHAATTVPPARPTATWAGLRTFASDRVPVVGFDPRHRGFFWYAGQGGYGIQTSPALSLLGAKLILGEALEPGEMELKASLDCARLLDR